METPKLLANTSILVFVLDLHHPENFELANEYFDNVYSAIKEQGGDPRVKVFYHKYDTEEYPKDALEKNLSEAKQLPFIVKNTPREFLTSVYRQEELSDYIKQILIADFEELKKSVEGAQEFLSNLNSKIIITDVNGNVITHNIEGFATGIQLREDLREYIFACNVLRENFLTSESAMFSATSEVKQLKVHIYNYVLTVLIMMDEQEPADPPEEINELLKEMKIFAELLIEMSSEE